MADYLDDLNRHARRLGLPANFFEDMRTDWAVNDAFRMIVKQLDIMEASEKRLMELVFAVEQIQQHLVLDLYPLPKD